MIFSYNPKHVGDVLMTILGPTGGKEVTSVRRGNISRIFLEETNETVGLNFFEITSILPDITGTGQIELSEDQVVLLNKELANENFEEKILNEQIPYFVIGFVKELVAHPDSEHLHVAKVAVSQEEEIQIVCGAKNIQQGQKVVVARVGAMLPDGTMIWEGELRGEKSFGMICSARELALPGAPDISGILVVENEANIGEEFSSKKHWKNETIS